MAYIGSQPTKVVSQQSSRVYRYTATAGQTVFSGADVGNQVLNVTPSDVEVHMNGLLLDATDYTVTSSSVTLVTAANAGDELTVTGMVTFEVADTYDKTTADARYVNAAGDTMTGGLNVTGGNVGVGTTSPSASIHAYHATTNVVGTFESGDADVYITLADNTTTSDTAMRIGVTGNDMHFSTSATKRIRIDSAGRVTMPYQPAFYAYLSSDVAVNVSGQHRLLVHNATRHNEGNHFNTSTGLFTAPIGGIYQFNTNIRFNAVASGGYMLQKLYVNPTVTSGQVTGGTNPQGMYNISTQLGSYNTTTLSCALKLEANDTVGITGYTNTDTSWLFDNNSHFSGYLLG